jgi:hypothetical protein
MDTQSMTTLFNLRKQKLSEAQAVKKEKLDKTINFWKEYVSAGKVLKGDAKKQWLVKGLEIVSPALKELNVSIPVDTFTEILNSGSKETLAEILPDLDSHFDAFVKGVYSPTELQKHVNNIIVRAAQLEDEERSTITDRIKHYESSIKPKEKKAPSVTNIQFGERNIPSIWNEEKGEYIPIKGAGGPSWKPEKKEIDPVKLQSDIIKTIQEIDGAKSETEKQALIEKLGLLGKEVVEIKGSRKFFSPKTWISPEKQLTLKDKAPATKTRRPITDF